MRVLWVFLGILPAASGLLWAQPSEAARQLVREVVYNELQDHDTHGYWRYWIQQRVQNGTQLENQVETADGPITRIGSFPGALGGGRRLYQGPGR